MTQQQEEPMETVVNAIVSSSSVDRGKIEPESWLVRDLGLESIDLLELNFELEQKTGVQVNFAEIIFEVQKKTNSLSRDLRVNDLVNHLVKNGKG
jgi:acyl carrier protein